MWVRIPPDALCPGSSVDGAGGYEPNGREFESPSGLYGRSSRRMATASVLKTDEAQALVGSIPTSSAWSDGRTVMQRVANSPTPTRCVGSNPTRSVRIRGPSGRTPAFQAGVNGFDPRLMLSCAGGQTGKGGSLRNCFLRVRLPPRVLRSGVDWNGPQRRSHKPDHIGSNPITAIRGR